MIESYGASLHPWASPFAAAAGVCVSSAAFASARAQPSITLEDTETGPEAAVAPASQDPDLIASKDGTDTPSGRTLDEGGHSKEDSLYVSGICPAAAALPAVSRAPSIGASSPAADEASEDAASPSSGSAEASEHSFTAWNHGCSSASETSSNPSPRGGVTSHNDAAGAATGCSDADVRSCAEPTDAHGDGALPALQRKRSQDGAFLSDQRLELAAVEAASHAALGHVRCALERSEAALQRVRGMEAAATKQAEARMVLTDATQRLLATRQTVFKAHLGFADCLAVTFSSGYAASANPGDLSALLSTAARRLLRVVDLQKQVGEVTVAGWADSRAWLVANPEHQPGHDQLLHVLREAAVELMSVLSHLNEASAALTEAIGVAALSKSEQPSPPGGEPPHKRRLDTSFSFWPMGAIKRCASAGDALTPPPGSFSVAPSALIAAPASSPVHGPALEPNAVRAYAPDFKQSQGLSSETCRAGDQAAIEMATCATEAARQTGDEHSLEEHRDAVVPQEASNSLAAATAQEPEAAPEPLPAPAVVKELMAAVTLPTTDAPVEVAEPDAAEPADADSEAAAAPELLDEPEVVEQEAAADQTAAAVEATAAAASAAEMVKMRGLVRRMSSDLSQLRTELDVRHRDSERLSRRLTLQQQYIEQLESQLRAARQAPGSYGAAADETPDSAAGAPSSAVDGLGESMERQPMLMNAVATAPQLLSGLQLHAVSERRVSVNAPNGSEAGPTDIPASQSQPNRRDGAVAITSSCSQHAVPEANGDVAQAAQTESSAHGLRDTNTAAIEPIVVPGKGAVQNPPSLQRTDSLRTATNAPRSPEPIVAGGGAMAESRAQHMPSSRVLSAPGVGAALRTNRAMALAARFDTPVTGTRLPYLLAAGRSLADCPLPREAPGPSPLWTNWPTSQVSSRSRLHGNGLLAANAAFHTPSFLLTSPLPAMHSGPTAQTCA